MTLTDTTLAEIEAAARAAGLPYSRRSGFQPTVLVGPDSRSVAQFHQDNSKGADPVARAAFAILACNNAAAMVEEIRALREALRPFAAVSAAFTASGDDNCVVATWGGQEEITLGHLRRAANLLKGTSDV